VRGNKAPYASSRGAGRTGARREVVGGGEGNATRVLCRAGFKTALLTAVTCLRLFEPLLERARVSIQNNPNDISLLSVYAFFRRQDDAIAGSLLFVIVDEEPGGEEVVGSGSSTSTSRISFRRSGRNASWEGTSSR